MDRETEAEIREAIEFITSETLIRTEADIRTAVEFVTHEMMHNPMATSETFGPLLTHYTVIRQALFELLRRRALDEILNEAAFVAKSKVAP